MKQVLDIVENYINLSFISLCLFCYEETEQHNQVKNADAHSIMECFDQTISTDMRVHNARSYILFEILETEALHYKLL